MIKMFYFLSCIIIFSFQNFFSISQSQRQNPETFFAHREVCNPYYNAVPKIVEKYMNEISKITGREYKLFSYYGADDAERIIIAMGSVTEAAREAYFDKQRAGRLVFSK